MSMHIFKFNNFEGLLRIKNADIVEKNGKKIATRHRLVATSLRRRNNRTGI
jgi:hypothetical protein